MPPTLPQRTLPEPLSAGSSESKRCSGYTTQARNQGRRRARIMIAAQPGSTARNSSGRFQKMPGAHLDCGQRFLLL